jgi:Domain of unknown function (DUF4190)
MASKDDKTQTVETMAEESGSNQVSAPVAEKHDFTRYNTLAIVSIATAISWVGAVAGVITGHIALAQIKRSGEKGRALAITGLVLGYLYIAGSIAMGALMLLFRIRGLVVGGSYGDGGWGMMGNFRNDQDGNGWGMMGR